MFDRIRKARQRLNQSFGEIKDDPFYFDSIERYFRNKDHSGDFQILSDKTCSDYDFKLKEGKLTTRNAIKIPEINDYPGQIINEAIELSKELDKIFVVNKHN